MVRLKQVQIWIGTTAGYKFQHFWNIANFGNEAFFCLLFLGITKGGAKIFLNLFEMNAEQQMLQSWLFRNLGWKNNAKNQA